MLVVVALSYFLELGIELRTLAMNYIPSLVLFFILRWGLTKLQSDLDWAQIHGHSKPASHSAEIIAGTIEGFMSF